MKRPVVIGLLFISAGVACVFPFIRSLILENIVVMLGVYLIYRGYLYLTEPTHCKGRCKPEKNISSEPSAADCNTACKKKD
jgi:hypothetical protein